MISVVMPIYNTGEYLKDSLHSLENQTYSDFELICVDDASTDLKTRQILSHYVDNDERIKIIWMKTNQGAGIARNKGLLEAKGEYLIFLDADDIFDSNMLEIMHQTITNNDADMCICGHRLISAKSGKIIEEQKPRMALGVTESIFSLENLEVDGLTYWLHVPWNKMLRTSFVKKNRILFPNYANYEDGYFFQMCNLLAKKIVYASDRKPLLSYRVENENQLTVTAENQINLCYQFIKRLFDERWKIANEREKNQLLYLYTDHIFRVLRAGKSEEEKKIFLGQVQKHLKEIDVETNLHKFSQIENRILFVLNNKYEKEKISNYEFQLLDNKMYWEKLIVDEKRIVIWGNGKRGQAFQKILKESKYKNILVIDRKTTKQKSKTIYGYDLIRLYSFPTSDIVFASNTLIYGDVKNQCLEKNICCINLENYCFL